MSNKKKHFDQEVVDRLMAKLQEHRKIDVMFRSDNALVLPYHEYAKWVSEHEEGYSGIETFAELGFGIDLSTKEIVYYVPMRGFNIHLNHEVDILIKLFSQEDLLIKATEVK